MEEMVDVSIVVPVYGVEKYLRQCLNSLACQTADLTLEYILVDDGGKDGCPAIIDEYARRDGRFRAVHQENGGYGKAVNCGMSLARGVYLGIVEPDDWVDSSMFESLYARALEDDADVVKSGYVVHHIETRKIEQFNFVETNGSVGIDGAIDLLYRHPSIWTCLYRTRFLRENCLRMVETRGAAWQDNPFFFQTLLLARRISVVGRAFYHYRVFDGKRVGYLLPLECSRMIREGLTGVRISSREVRRAICNRYIIYFRMALASVGLVELLRNRVVFSRQLAYIDSEAELADSLDRSATSCKKGVHRSIFLDWLAVRVDIRKIIRNVFGARALACMVKIKRLLVRT